MGVFLANSLIQTMEWELPSVVLEPGDAIVLMGAGDVATIWTEIADALGARP